MRTDQLARFYRETRKGYVTSASNALRVARVRLTHQQTSCIPVFASSDDHITWTDKGFDFVARIRPDDDGDTSFLGEFSDTWQPGCIKLHATSYRAKGYYVPAITYAETRATLLTMNYGRAEADRIARESVYAQHKRLRQLHEGYWNFVGVEVVASRVGVELARVSLWGIESDAGDYFDEVTQDLASEAIDAARAALKRLKCRK